MHTHASGAAESAAHVLATIVAADGSIDEGELKTLDRLHAYSRLGTTRKRFIDLTRSCLQAAEGNLSEERRWLRLTELINLNRVLDGVTDRDQRILVCRLAAAAITADGWVTPYERTLYDHVLWHWNVSQSAVTEAILHDRLN